MEKKIFFLIIKYLNKLLNMIFKIKINHFITNKNYNK